MFVKISPNNRSYNLGRVNGVLVIFDMNEPVVSKTRFTIAIDDLVQERTITTGATESIKLNGGVVTIQNHGPGELVVTLPSAAASLEAAG
jgi:hypothetical protein